MRRGSSMESCRRWEEMERDCLVCIFEKLSLEDLTLGVAFVCKSWCGASLDPLCWRVLDFQRLDFMPWRRFAKRVAARYPLSPFSFSAFLRFAVRRSRGLAVELRFPLFLQVSVEDLVYASNECPRLKILVLRSLRLEDQASLPKLVGKWKELEHLEMASNPSSFPDLAAEIGANCRNFSRLKMAGLRTEDALAIVSHLPGLKYLNLSNSYMPKGTLLLIMGACREIEVLVVNRCIGFQSDEEVLEKASRIRVFKHEGSKLMDDSGYDSDEFVPFCMLCFDCDGYGSGRQCLP
ncbi:F-box/LRR-repeat protein-like [Iris pallida]|uniref:F-box/LRR-repeat protein-like n=1 Tax=Iris pallida TaxID=29817 RepID=A0AAX6I0X9_IRIPA|nr:F-box/LRR-repeat protein-like [Iris pallida]